MKIRKPTPAGAVLAGVILVLSLALVPAAFAGKGSGGGSGGHPGGGGGGGGSSGGTVTGPVMKVDNNGNGSPNWGDTITFNVSTSATWPSVEVDCVQNGALVYQGIVGFYPTYAWSRDYTLQSYSWTGGAADCTARLYTTGKNGSQQTLATLSFPVGA
jgi:hypothetical protein